MIKKKSKNKNGGFTLIELLVVIAIMGLLSSIIGVSVSSARLKSRDAKRISDLATIRTALEMYYDDQGHYPDSSSGVSGWWGSMGTENHWDSLQTALKPYLSNLPKDPTNSTGAWTWNTGNYGYAYRSAQNTSPQEYDLVTQFEDINNPYTCAKQCWRYKTHPSNPNVSWCAGCSAPTGTWSPYVYADH